MRVREPKWSTVHEKKNFEFFRIFHMVANFGHIQCWNFQDLGAKITWGRPEVKIDQIFEILSDFALIDFWSS